MRLNKSQKELVLQWIAEGVRSDVMNRRAAKEAEPFKVTRQQVDYYRKQCDAEIKNILGREEFQALNTGLALRSVRVEKLKKLAELMELDLFGKLLWVDRLKSVGGGPNFTTFIEKEFNKAEVDAYSRILDDIAKELGHRVHKTELSTDPAGEIHVTFHNPYAPSDE